MNDTRIVKTLSELTCLRCGHKWIPRKRLVGACPKCHSPYWNIPKETPPQSIAETLKQIGDLKDTDSGKTIREILDIPLSAEPPKCE